MHSFILLKLKFRACNAQHRIQTFCYSFNNMGAQKNLSKNAFSIFKILGKELNEIVHKYLGNKFFSIDTDMLTKGIKYQIFLDSQPPQWEAFWFC